MSAREDPWTRNRAVTLSVVRNLRSPRSLSTGADAIEYQEHLFAEFVLARTAHGTGDSTIRHDLSVMEEFVAWAGVPVWEIEPPHVDRFLGQVQRERSLATRRRKATSIEMFFRFLEVRYRGEIRELTGRTVCSPVDSINRPTHNGDFTVRVPPAPGDLRTFFGEWRDALEQARKWLVAVRHYTMARLVFEVGLRRGELCGLTLDDLHFDHGPFGKIHVRLGKGSRGSGPRERLVPMLGAARPLLVWWVEEVRGEFNDEWALPRSPLFPSERGGPIRGETFAEALRGAASCHLRGPVSTLTPHVLRHACASSLYADGVGLVAIQELLGHRWLTTTMRYVHVARDSIEAEYRMAAERASTRFKEG